MQDIAIVFPGQGSQKVGMMSPHADSAVVRQTFEEASDVLAFDVWELVAADSQQRLNQTEFTQVAMLTAGIALWRQLPQRLDIKDPCLAGHSLGEYSALVAAEVLSFADALALVRLRGRLMQAAVPAGTGAMAAILGMTQPELEALCRQLSTQDHFVSQANLNAPGQIVVAGHSAAVQQLVSLAREQGAKRALLLSVSVPSHCRLMQGAAAELEQALNDYRWQRARYPVVQNVDAQIHVEPEAIKQALVAQLYSPVQWVQSVQALIRSAGTLIECGPDQTLTALNKRISPNSRCLAYAQVMSEEDLHGKIA